MSNSKKWYIEDHGQALGPLSTDDLLERIHKNEIRRVDLIFKEGDDEWSPMENYADELGLKDSAQQFQGDWVVLRSVEIDGTLKHEQSGPFATGKILEMVDQGDIRFNDYVWRQGFDHWVPLGAVEELAQPLASSVKVDVSLYEVPKPFSPVGTEVAAVREYHPGVQQHEAEAIPAEAGSNDMAQPVWEKVANPSLNTDLEIIDEATSSESPIEDGSLQSEPAVSQEAAPLKAEGPITLGKVGSHFKALRTAQLPKAFKYGSALVVLFAMILLGRSVFVAPTQAPIASEEIASTEGQESMAASTMNESANEREVASSKKKKKKKAKGKKAKSSVKKANKNTGAKLTNKKSVVPRLSKKASKGLPSVKKSSFKKRSFYHHRDQKIIFYTAQRGLNLVDELSYGLKKHQGRPSAWKKFYTIWKRRLYSNTPKDLRDKSVDGSYLYPALMLKLSKAMHRLKTKGEVLDAEMRSSRKVSQKTKLRGVRKSLSSIRGKAKTL